MRGLDHAQYGSRTHPTPESDHQQDGDVVDVEITDIGMLRNPVVRER